MSQRQCADCSAAMLRVPYMKDPHSKRVWLDRCPQCRAIWFDAGEAEDTAGTDHLHLQISANETQAQLVNLAKDLAAKGEIMISKNRGDEELVY